MYLTEVGLRSKCLTGPSLPTVKSSQLVLGSSLDLLEIISSGRDVSQDPCELDPRTWHHPENRDSGVPREPRIRLQLDPGAQQSVTLSMTSIAPSLWIKSGVMNSKLRREIYAKIISNCSESTMKE